MKIYTNEGIVGYGEPNPYHIDISKLNKLINDFIPNVINQKINDLLNIKKFFSKKGNKFTNELAPVISGFSQCIWDIHSKSKNSPLYKVINKKINQPKEIEFYASGGMYYEWNDPGKIADEVIKIKEMGYNIWKMRPPLPYEASHIQRTATPPPINHKKTIQFLESVRKSVGNKLKIIIDFGCRLGTINEAVSFIKKIEDYDLLFIEEPIARNLNDYKELKKKLNVKVSGGESLTNINDVKKWINNDCYDILQPDANLLGIENLYKAIKISFESNVQCILHNWTHAVNAYANLHVAVASNRVTLVENNIIENPLNDFLFSKKINPKNSKYKIDDAPGLGVDILEDYIDDYKFKI